SFVQPSCGQLRERFNMALLRLTVQAVLSFTIAAAGEGFEPFGHGLRRYFLLDSNYTNLNHGSYGATPVPVLDAERQWQNLMERNPDHWFRFDGPDTLIGAVDGVRTRVAKYVKAAAEDIVFVDGASGGVNAVIRSIRLPSTASILYLNTAYQMVKNTISYVHQNNKMEPLLVNISLPAPDAEIVALVERALAENPSVQLASFSHITSVPAVILPVQELTRVCREKGVMVLIDGAHAMGQIPLDIPAIGADFYVANGHKWLYSPKGSAILWVSPDKQHLVHPPVISDEGRGSTFFQLQFSYTGTKDYSAFLAVSAALDFRDRLGGEDRIMQYMHELASKGGDLLAEKLGTYKMATGEMAMVNVGLPAASRRCCTIELSRKLLVKRGTLAPVYPWQGDCFVRVSAQIYNDLSDFAFLAKALLDILETDCNSEPLDTLEM
ncbi:unnamed protein product, partial [Effrenium voratum]